MRTSRFATMSLAALNTRTSSSAASRSSLVQYSSSPSTGRDDDAGDVEKSAKREREG